jgi:ABC-type transporter MlaC component
MNKISVYPIPFNATIVNGRVYDAIVENISIVSNYRSQFDRVISKSCEELKKMLKEKAG